MSDLNDSDDIDADISRAEHALAERAERRPEYTSGISEATLDAIDAWVVQARDCGGFVSAVLCNDLFAALSLADPVNRVQLPNIVRYLYNEAPAACWGDEELVDEWRFRGGEIGRRGC